MLCRPTWTIKKNIFFLTNKNTVLYYTPVLICIYIIHTHINHPYPGDVIVSDLWIYYACIVVEYYEGVWIRVDRQYETSINKRTLVNAQVHISNLFPLYLQTPYLWGFWYMHRYRLHCVVTFHEKVHVTFAKRTAAAE